MNTRFLLPALAVLGLLSLSGCGIPGGVAQLVKAVEKNQERTAAAPVERPAPAPQPAAYQEAPPPAAAPRDSIQVEQLPPPRG